MTVYNGNIGNLLQGVSQQPRRDRRPEQVEVQENCQSSITSGIGKRPGTTEASPDIAIEDFNTAKKHTYDRGSGDEKYTLIGGPGTLDVVDINTGTKRTVNGDASYLLNTTGNGQTPEEYLRFFTIADTTIVVNTTKVVEMNIETGDPGWQCCLYLSAAKYGKKYQVYADGNVIAEVETQSTVTVGSTDEVNKTINMKASDVMLQLAEGAGAVQAAQAVQMQVWCEDNFLEFTCYTADIAGYAAGQQVSFADGVKGGSPTTIYYLGGITDHGETSNFVVRNASGLSQVLIVGIHTVMSIRPYPTNPSVSGSIRAWAQTWGVDMQTAVDTSVVVLNHTGSPAIEVSDDDNGECFRIIGTTLDSYDKLPAVCAHGYKVKILGEDADIVNDYYVHFERDDNDTGIGRGVWRECAGFNEPVGFDATTMPHQIISNADGTFTISEIDWDIKAAGDEDSNPKPSFVGSTITSLGLYQNRFVFLTEENAVASVTYDHFNLFADSVLVSSDDDPIDTASSDNHITNLEHLIIFNSSLLILSDKAQFLHSGDTAFTPSTFALASKSQYTADTTSAPVASATSVFFPYKLGEFVGLREFRIDELTGIVSADSITQHIKEYIPGYAKQIVSSTDHNILLVRVSGDPYAVYVYEWFDQDHTRKQAAWHVWTFTTEILHLDILQDTLYLWHASGTDTVRFATLDLADRDSTALDFPLRLDLKSMVQATDDGDYWIVSRDLASLHTTWDEVVVAGGLNSGIEGARATWSPLDDDSGVRIPKNAIPNPTGTPWFYIGVRYNSKVTITNPFVRDQNGIPKTTSKTTLKTVKFNMSETGYLKVTVAKESAPTYEVAFDSRSIGSSAFLLNSAAPLQDAELRVPIRVDASRCSITMESDSHLPFHVLDVDWSGSYNERGRRTS